MTTPFRSASRKPTVAFLVAALTVAFAASPASAAVLNDMKAGMAEAHTFTYASNAKLWKGTPGTPVVSGCTALNWMSSTCAYSVEVTPKSGAARRLCSGSITVTRHQQKFTFKVPVGGKAVCTPIATPARVYPNGLSLGEAERAATAAVAAMTLPQVGSHGVAAPGCIGVSWMAARCMWSVVVTTQANKVSTCTGTLSIVKRQVKGYPITATQVARTKVKCTTPTTQA